LGVVVSLVAGILHPERANANDHVAAFTEYAGSELWIGVHLGQFAGMAILIAGLYVLGSALAGVPGRAAGAARLGKLAAAAALALYGCLQAVDGVALKHSVDAWAAADGAEKAVRFAAAEDMRVSRAGLGDRDGRIFEQQHSADPRGHCAHPGLDHLAARKLVAQVLARRVRALDHARA
jgi:hypothetical protein